MMDDDDDKLSTKSVKLPVFSGDHKHFQTWWFQFSAFATVWKFKQAVGQTEDPDLPESEAAALNTDANVAEKQKMAKKRNVIAFANLTAALDSPSLIGILMRAQTTEWPSGLACNVIKQLFEKYEPKDTVSLIDMNRLKQKIGLTNAQGNPQELFKQMAAIENQFKTEIPEAEKVAMVIEKLPVEYRSVLTAEMRKEGIGITSSHIESAAFQHWRAMYGSFASNPVIDNGTTTADNNKEVALAAFNGTCNRCGKHGHNEVECYSKQHINGQALGAKQGTNNMQQQNEQKQNAKGQSKTRFKGTCNYCSKYGHEEADCRKKKADKKKGNGKQETGATAIAGSDKSTEFLLYAGLECGLMSTKNMFPDSYDLLQMPETWIGDMAATTDMTPHRMGMTEVTNPQGDIHIVMGNKQVEKSTAIGCISSIVCDNQGNQKLNVKITDVALVPDCAFNLFSLSKQLK